MSRVDDLERRYVATMHAIQSGVAVECGIDGASAGDRTPKHLRVGVNSALLESSALMQLLERKGIATREEIMTSLVEMAEAEKRKYEDKLSARLGKKVTLG